MVAEKMEIEKKQGGIIINMVIATLARLLPQLKGLIFSSFHQGNLGLLNQKEL